MPDPDHCTVLVSAAVAREQAEALRRHFPWAAPMNPVAAREAIDAAISTLSRATEAGGGGDLAARLERARAKVPYSSDPLPHEFWRGYTKAIDELVDALGVGDPQVTATGHQWVPDSWDDEGPPEWMCSRPGCAARLTGIGDGCAGDILATTPHQPTAEAPDRFEDGSVYVRTGSGAVARTEQVLDSVRLDWSAENGTGEADLLGVEVLGVVNVDVDGISTNASAFSTAPPARSRFEADPRDGQRFRHLDCGTLRVYPDGRYPIVLDTYADESVELDPAGARELAASLAVAADLPPVERPPLAHCCRDMSSRLDAVCDEHPNGADCPDSIVTHNARTGEYGIRVHDGGSSYIVISHCPWCAAALPAAERDAGGGR